MRYMNDSVLTRLHRLGYRETEPRRLVIATLRRARTPLSPYDIEKRITRDGGAIRASTVYRTLELLEEHGFVHRTPFRGGFLLCELSGNPHHHGFFHCTRCGSICEFADKALCHSVRRLAAQRRFRVEGHTAEITGLCTSCFSSSSLPC